MARNTKREDITILVVEDSETDAVLLREALRQLMLRANVAVTVDGQYAVRLLQTQCTNGRWLVFLDLHLRRGDGFETLRRIRADPHLRTVPVVVLTSSRKREDQERSYSLDANYFLTKPIDLEGYRKVLAPIAWLCGGAAK